MTAADGKTCNTKFYDLDAIISVGLPGFSSAWQDQSFILLPPSP